MKRYDSRELEAVIKVIKSGKLSPFFNNFRGGEQVQTFEVEIAEYLGVKNIVLVCNGTVSLEIALAALGVKSGDEVITTPLTFFATTSAILRVGATPVYVDIEKDTLNINSTLIEEAITDKTRAILPVSLLGMPCDIHQIMKITKRHGLAVLHDIAQALGATINGKKLGSIADMASGSFQESKQINMMGEGGWIATNDDRLADLCRNIRNHGNVYGNLIDIISTNARPVEVAAAFGRVQLTKLDLFNKIQIENAEYFLKCLHPPLYYVYKNIPKGYEPIYLLIPTFLTNGRISSPHIRDDLIKYLTAEGVSKGVPGQNVGYYKALMYEHPIVQNSPKYKKPDCPVAEWMRDHIVLFDVHRWHAKAEVTKTISIINEWAEHVAIQN